MGGFIRAQVSNDGRLPQPMRAGDGMLANFGIKAFAAEADATLTVGDIAGGMIFQGTTLSSDVVYTMPTATLIQAADIFSSMDIGDSYSFLVVNSQVGAFDVVIAVGTGITKVGANNTISVAPQTSRIFCLVKTGTNTFNLY